MAKSNLPYGDAFIVQTPALDKLTANAYAEDRQRQQQKIQQSKVLEDEFRKNISNVRAIDIPKVTEAWQNYKTLSQGLLKPTTNTDQTGFVQKQLDKQNALANVYKIINDSRSKKTEEDEMFKDYQKNPDNYDDNFGNLMTARRNTPLDKLSQYQTTGADGKPVTYDLSNPSTFRYKGTNTDFSKIDKSAQGIAKANWLPEEPVDKSGIQFKQRSFMYGSTPLQYYQSTLGSLSQHKSNRDAAAIISQTDPKMIQTIQDEYHNLPLDYWQKIGLSEPQNLDILPTDPPAVVYSKHMGQLYALNNVPKEGETKFRTNEDLKMDKQSNLTLRNEKTMASLRHNYTLGEIEFRKGLDNTDAQTSNSFIDSVLKNKQDSAPLETGGYKSKGFSYDTKNISLDPVLTKALGGKTDFLKYIPKDDVYVYGSYKRTQSKDEDSKLVTSSVDKDASGRNVVDDASIRIIKPQDLKLALGYKILTKKDLGKEMKGSVNQPTKKGILD